MGAFSASQVYQWPLFDLKIDLENFENCMVAFFENAYEFSMNFSFILPIGCQKYLYIPKLTW